MVFIYDIFQTLLTDDQIASLYEAAAKHQPNSEDILSCLFMAHVRLGNYQQQQRTAMMLHKIRPNKNPYYFWAVMSIVMQVMMYCDIFSIKLCVCNPVCLTLQQMFSTFRARNLLSSGMNLYKLQVMHGEDTCYLDNEQHGLSECYGSIIIYAHSLINLAM